MPWYKTGTVSVTQNSNAVIGTGTAFIANSRVGDGFRGPDGRWYEVTNIASNTALSISPNYEGPTVAGGFYSIMPVQGYQKDLADQVRSWVNTYGPKMAALGSTGNYETLPFSKGGTNVAVNNSTELLAALGALPAVGGAYNVRLNSISMFGAANPNSQGAFIGWNETNGSGLVGGVSFTCNQGGGTGGFSWRSVNSTNTVGGPFMTYSFGGVLNVPTGIQLGGRNIVESGSTSNGSWIRYADGTQECWIRNLGFGPTTANVTALANWSPPAAFVGNVATVMATLQYAETTEAFTIARLNANMGSNGVVSVQANFSASQVYRIGLRAIGRWF